MLEISSFLARHYSAEFRPIQVEPLGSAGGMSGAQFWRVKSPRGVLVLRQWPAEHPTVDWLRFIHAVLKHAAARGLSFLPIPVTTIEGGSFVQQDGYLFELAPWMPGEANFQASPSADKLRAAMAALARFHLATADFGPTLQSIPGSDTTYHLTAIPRRIDGLRKLNPNELLQSIDDRCWPELAPLARQFVARLPHEVPIVIERLQPLLAARLSTQPCLRDVWHDHILFTGNEVTGLLDFGAIDIDTPTTDIARLLGSLAGNDADSWRFGITAYSALRPLAPEEVQAALAIDAASNLLAGCNWIRWIYSERRSFGNRAQVVDRFRGLLDRRPIDLSGNRIGCK